MTTKAHVIPTIERVGSHSFHEDYNGAKEELFVYFDTEWRGTPARVTIRVYRQRHREGNTLGKWSKWFSYATEARAIDPEANGQRGKELTDTARSRLGEGLTTLAEAWIGTPDYVASRQRAVARFVRDLFPNVDRVRAAITKYNAELSTTDIDRFARAADAYQRYLDVFNEYLDG